MAAPPSCRALMNRTRWLWYMPSSAARKLSPGTPNAVSAPCRAGFLQRARVMADVLAGVRERHQRGEIAIEGCLAIEIEHAALGAGGRDDTDHLREIEAVLGGKRKPLAPCRHIGEGDIVVNELEANGVPEWADVKNVFGIELEIGPEVVEQVALAAEQHIDLADLGMFRGSRHRRFGVAPAGRAHHPVELCDHLRAAGGMIH